MEPDYDEQDESSGSSYELTAHVPKGDSLGDLLGSSDRRNMMHEIVAAPESDDEGVDNYECTHDQQLSDPDDLDSVEQEEEKVSLVRVQQHQT